MLAIFSCRASLSPQLPKQLHPRSSNNGGLEKVKILITKTGIPSKITSSLESLQKGNWVKLICGASFEDVTDIRNLSLVYTLAGVDCIDCAAEASVVNAVQDGIEAARSIFPVRKPWVMISVNDNEDLHFRKAEFDPNDCPIDCSRPCENVCPADAISFSGKAGQSEVLLHFSLNLPRHIFLGLITSSLLRDSLVTTHTPFLKSITMHPPKFKISHPSSHEFEKVTFEISLDGCLEVIFQTCGGCIVMSQERCMSLMRGADVINPIFKHCNYIHKQGGVLTERCYGCGRCLPICPYDKIKAITYIRDVAATAELLTREDIDAIEIHTSGRQIESFQELWNGLGDSIDKLRLVAVSLPDIGELTIPAMNSMYSKMKVNLKCLNLWQLDGRPMSGDIGRGATREAIEFGLHLASIRDKPNGFLQLAGGTIAHTVEGLKKERLFQTTTISDNENAPLNSSESSHALISGVAFGGYARKIVGRVLSSLQTGHDYACLEDYPDHLLNALKESLALVGTVKSYNVS